jgi:hypothetical protein
MKSIMVTSTLTPYIILIGVLLVVSPSFRPPLLPITWVTGDRMDWAIRRLAVWNTRNCGRVQVGGDAREASSCVLSAFHEKSSFRVRFDLLGVDAGPTVSLVGDSNGHVYQLSFLSTPVGGSIFGGRVDVKHCQEPIVFEKLGDLSGLDRGMIRCQFFALAVVIRRRKYALYARGGGGVGAGSVVPGN